MMRNNSVFKEERVSFLYDLVLGIGERDRNAIGQSYIHGIRKEFQQQQLPVVLFSKLS